jgi:hypothetical protein
MGIIYCLGIHTIRIQLLNLFPVYVSQVILAAYVVSKSVKGKLVYYCPFMKSKYILKFLVPLYAFLYHFFYLANKKYLLLTTLSLSPIVANK